MKLLDALTQAFGHNAVEAAIAEADLEHRRTERIAEQVAEHLAEISLRDPRVPLTLPPPPVVLAALRRLVETDQTHTLDDATIVREWLAALERLDQVRRRMRDGEA